MINAYDILRHALAEIYRITDRDNLDQSNQEMREDLLDVISIAEKALEQVPGDE